MAGDDSRSWASQCSSFFNKQCSRFNRAFSYKSQKVVRVIDRRMGLLALFLRLIILGYLAVAIYLSQSYKDEEHAIGALIARGSGESYSKDNHEQVRFWDYADVLYPPTEVGAIFIATRVIRTNVQTVQLCANPAHPCSPENNATSLAGEDQQTEADSARRRLLMATPPPTAASNRPSPPPDTTDTPGSPPGDEDGSVDDPMCTGEQNGVMMPEAPYGTGKCAGTGKGCLEYIWCPAEGVSRLRTLDMKLEKLGGYQIQFQSVISFPVFASGEKPLQYSEPKMTLSELLTKVGADEQEVLDNGAVISARVMYECDLDETPLQSCKPTVTLRRLDNENQGFSFRRATYYYTSSGERARDTSRLVGLRVLLSAYGVAKQASYLKLILHCSIGLTLLGFASTLTDYYMCHICDDQRFFRNYKIEDSDDFSDLAERLQNLDQDKQRELLKEKRHRMAVAAKQRSGLKKRR